MVGSVATATWTTLATRVLGTSFTVDRLEKNKIYTFAVRAENSHGLSPPSPLSEPLALNTLEKTVESAVTAAAGTIQEREMREAKALLQATHSAELVDIQAVNSTSVKLTWEVSERVVKNVSKLFFQLGT